MFPRQLFASIALSAFLLILVIRLVQKQRLDIAYCWLWLAIGMSTLVVVIKYDWLNNLSEMIGAVSNTTTVFLLGFFVILLMCLQFSLVISAHRRQLKKLTQQLGILEAKVKAGEPATTAAQKDTQG